MSYTSNFNLNQRVSYLESEIGKIAPIPPGGYNLANVLTIGNSAGTSDIDLNNQDILQVNNIDVSTINGSAYPLDLSAVLTAGNSADNNIILTDNINKTANFSSSTAVYSDSVLPSTTTIDSEGVSCSSGTNQIGMNVGVSGTPIFSINDNATSNYSSSSINGLTIVNTSTDPTITLSGASNQVIINTTNGLTITDNVANITNLTLNSLSFNDGTYTPSIGIAGSDLVIDGQGARVLINGNDAEFYIGQYSASTAPCIISSGNAGMSLTFNSRSGTATMGDVDNAFNQTKISLDDTTNTITLDSRSGKSQMGDINNVGNYMKIVVDDGAGVINIDNGGDAPINIGDLGGNGNGTKLIVNDATATFTIQFPTINFQNTTTTTAVQNHTSALGTTSNIGDITTYLKCKLNGTTDIWIPYFTTDPSV